MRSDLEEERIPLGRTSTSDEDEEEDDYPPPAQPDMRIENALKPRARNKLVVALLPATIILLLVIAIFKPIDVSSVVTSASELSSWKQASDVGPIEVHEGVEQRIVEWKGEDLKLREYKWGQHEPHASLVSLVQTLNESDARTRTWLLETRPYAQAGTGIGLGSTVPPERVQPAPPASGPRGLPKSSEGPGVFTGGSYTKYAELLQEWQTGRQVTSCVKGKWEDAYAEMHHEMMIGQRQAKLLEYHCEESHGCGGLADRLLGVMTSFLYSILTNRAISVSWEHPVPFDLLFDSAYVDWSQRYHPDSTSTPHPVYSNATLLAQRTDFSALNWHPKVIDEYFPGVPAKWSTFEQPWIRFITNRGFVLRAFAYPNVAKQLAELGLTHSTAYSCMLDYLIRPKPDVLSFVAQYTSLFSLPNFYSIAIQIRTGDLSMTDPEADKLNTVEKHQAYFTCADQVARAYARADQHVIYYLLSDSESLKAAALAQMPDKVIVSGLGAKHTELYKSEDVAGSADGMMVSIAESWAIAGTDFQILTERSGFGKIPTWLRGRPGSTVTVPKTGSKKKPPSNCGLDIALVSYTTLAESWSLGRKF